MARRHNFRHNRQGHLLRRSSANIQPDWSMNAPQLLVRKPLLSQSFITLFPRLTAPNRTDICHLAGQYDAQSRLIELGIMCQDCHRGRRVQIHLLQHFIRPGHNQLISVGKPFTRGKGTSRINHHNPVIQGLGKGCQGNSDVSGTNNYKCWRRRETFYEDIKSLRTTSSPNAICPCSCLPGPDSTLSIFNYPRVKICHTQCPISLLAWQNKQLCPHMFRATHHCCHRCTNPSTPHFHSPPALPPVGEGQNQPLKPQ